MNLNPLAIRRKRRKQALRRARRERRAAKRARKLANRPAPVPFVVGVNRSGTTLLRMMLDSHPDLAIPPETHFIPALFEAADAKKKAGERMSAQETVDFLVEHRRWGDFDLDTDALRERITQAKRVRPRFAVRAFYELYAESQGKSRYGDKTPGYVKQMGTIQRTLPEARFVHLIRDGRDVAISRGDRITAEELTIERHAKIWKRRIGRARRQAPRLSHYKEVRYEDLVEDPEAVLREICEFIELPYDPAMLAYHERSADRLQEIARDLDDEDGGALRPAEERLEAHSLVTEAPRSDRVGRWHELMEPEDVAKFEVLAGDLLDELGYEISTPEGREAVASAVGEPDTASEPGLGGGT
ncbi:MAG: sulfotransferase [Actinomycetota bacterium]|nr:sulfotransferase [Actinomycetota bacterium]